MNPLVLKKEVLHEMVYHLLTRIISDIPRDVEDYLEKQLASEKAPLASLQLKNTLENIHYARDNSALSCGDTGYPLFYIYLGGNILFEGGPHILYEVCQDVVAKATKESRLRSTMVHPLTRVNVGTNVGSFMPYIDIRMDPKLVGLKVIFVPKGGDLRQFFSNAPSDGWEKRGDKIHSRFGDGGTLCRKGLPSLYCWYRNWWDIGFLHEIGQRGGSAKTRWRSASREGNRCLRS